MPKDATTKGARLAAWRARHNAELRLVLRITVAALLTFWLAHLLELRQGYWAVLTAVIINQGNVGGSLKAAIDRLLGTLSGGAFGALVATALPLPGPLWHAAALALGVAPLALLAAIRPQLRIAPVTAIIVLLGSSSQAAGPLPAAIDRMLEIGLGSIVGFAVSLFVLPTRAHTQLTEAAARVLDLLAELAPALLAGLTHTPDVVRLQQLNRRIRQALAKVDGLADEARRERASRLADEPDPEPLLRTIRRLRYDFVIIDRAAREPFPAPIAEPLAPPLADLSAALVATIAGCSQAIAKRQAPLPAEALARAVAAYDAAMNALRRRGLTRELASEATTRIFGLAFAFGQLRREIDDLVDRARELARES